MTINDFKDKNLQKGDGLLLRFKNGVNLQGNYRGAFNLSEMTFSFYNTSTEKIQTIKIPELEGFDWTSRASS